MFKLNDTTCTSFNFLSQVLNWHSYKNENVDRSFNVHINLSPNFVIVYTSCRAAKTKQFKMDGVKYFDKSWNSENRIYKEKQYHWSIMLVSCSFQTSSLNNQPNHAVLL